MIDIAIYGAGGLGKETILLINQINELNPTYNIQGYFDDDSNRSLEGLRYLGGISRLNDWEIPINIVIAVADPLIRFQIVEKLINKNISFPTLVHPSCNLGDSNNKIGKGCIITAGNIFTIGISLGDFSIVNLCCTIGHDTQIGTCCSIMPGARLSGAVKLGDRVLIGSGAVILQNISIGNAAKVGAGSVVINEVMADATVVGVPAKVIRHERI